MRNHINVKRFLLVSAIGALLGLSIAAQQQQTKPTEEQLAAKETAQLLEVCGTRNQRIMLVLEKLQKENDELKAQTEKPTAKLPNLDTKDGK